MTTVTKQYTGMRRPLGLAAICAGALLAACQSTPESGTPDARPATTGEVVASGGPERTAPSPAPAQPVATTRDGAEQRVRKTARYVVKKGDTLWGIADRFLIDPWKWPEVWVANRQVSNPHLIYPGDVLELRWLEGSERVADVRKLSPRIRRKPLTDAIPTIPLDQIKDFLRGPQIVDKATLENAPYVVEFDQEHLIGPDRVGIYARELPEDADEDWLVLHPGAPYVDPDSGETLGYEAIPAADATLARHAREVAVLELTRAHRETRIGDVLIPKPTDELSANFYPRAPDGAVDGRIISVFGGVTQIGQYNLVVLNRGSADGLASGHVLDVYSAAREVKDPQRSFGRVSLPAEFAGQLLVVRVTDRLSQALVMEAVRPILLHDEVHAPDRRP